MVLRPGNGEEGADGRKWQKQRYWLVIDILWQLTGALVGRIYATSLHAGGMPGCEDVTRNNDGTITCILAISAPAAFAEVGIMAKLAERG